MTWNKGLFCSSVDWSSTLRRAGSQVWLVGESLNSERSSSYYLKEEDLLLHLKSEQVTILVSVLDLLTDALAQSLFALVHQ